MPLKIIEFDHNGQVIRAEVFYNFSTLSDTVLIIPLDNAYDLNENILLTREKGRWRTSSVIRQQYPSTLNNIISCVNKELNIKTLTDHIFSLLNFLS